MQTENTLKLLDQNTLVQIFHQAKLQLVDVIQVTKYETTGGSPYIKNNQKWCTSMAPLAFTWMYDFDLPEAFLE